MKVWTYKEIRDKVLLDLDLTNESIVDADEMVGYCNDAIHEAESEILKLHEDYFLTKATLAFVKGQEDYDLPADIYAQKLRAVIYQNGSTIYTLRRLRGPDRYIEIALTNYSATTQDYRYLIRNPSVASGYKIQFVPAARETGTFVTLWYIRNALRIPKIADGSLAATENTRVDIPEFYTFIIETMKGLCRAKDSAGVIPQDAVARIEQQRKMMVDSLTQMVPDDDDSILGDFSHYMDSEA